jgi:hypothetical protein
MVDQMAPFLADNEVFNSLAFLLTDDVNATTVSCLASFLLMFDYLENFKLSGGEEGIVNDLDIIIQALTVHTGLRKLDFWGVAIGRRGSDSLVKLLKKSSSLKELHFNDIRGIIDDSDDGWLSIFTAVQSTRSKLDLIEMTGAEGVNEQTALCLSHALLHHRTTLKSLFWDQQVRVVIPLLQDPNTILEELYLFSFSNDDNYMTNEEIEVLTAALATNSSLENLEILRRITTEGWVILSAILRNPNSKLEYLTLEGNEIFNDTVINSFADALTSNRKLRELEFMCSNRFGCAALPQTLCNKSSIISTFNSNHTLERICGGMVFVPEELTSLLRINRENSVSQAARLKIIKTHFSGNNINMEPFNKMAVNVRPHAIEWMAKDMHLYELLRAMPSLLDQFEGDVIRSKKRTRKI